MNRLSSHQLKAYDAISESEQRVALIIGNQNYISLNSLKNPINDAKAMAEILRKKNNIFRECFTS